jgi:hypothetical protein
MFDACPAKDELPDDVIFDESIRSPAQPISVTSGFGASANRFSRLGLNGRDRNCVDDVFGLASP